MSVTYERIEVLEETIRQLRRELALEPDRLAWERVSTL